MSGTLDRSIGVGGALVLGLGSMVGTGVFVSLGIATGIAGPSVLLAITIAAVVASCNALSSAQLAAAHPVSGGTYEYGYHYLTPVLGFAAGWMFLVAKSASAATAAIGLSGYLLTALGVSAPAPSLILPVVTVALVTIVAAAGLKRSTLVNTIIVSITLITLVFVVVVSVPRFDASAFRPFFAGTTERGPVSSLLLAAALSFVAFTGYGRIATLGEEIREPERNIPRAIAVTVVVVFLIYVLIAGSGVTVLSATGYAEATRTTGAPLEIAVRVAAGGIGATVVTVGAAVALLGVLLNLVLGLSRVLLAMGRRKDMPEAVARVSGGTPRAAVAVMGTVVAALTLLGDVRVTWSFSAITVLTYYSLTNLSALALPREDRRFPRWISVMGLVGSVSLAAFVDLQVVGFAGITLAIGMIWYLVARTLRNRG